MDKIILYTTGCPKCTVLKAKLDAKGVKYEENHSVEEMTSLGISTVPVLRVGEELMDFSKAVQYVNNL